MTISPADMLLFAAVVREGSFTRAARSLGVTKQTTSERLLKLEDRLGVRLLERTTRHLKVTEAGSQYYERCAAIASQIDEANAEVQRRQAEPVGLLRVSTPVLYGRRFLGPVVAEYMARHPKVRVELVLADRRVALIEEGFDLAIRVGGADDSSLTARKLDEGHVYYLASPAFLARHGQPSPRELSTLPCVGQRPVESWEVGGVASKIEPVLVVNDLEVACEVAEAGVGVARLPALVCRQAVRDGRLRVLFGAEPALVRAVHAVYPSRRHLTTKVRTFLDALVAQVGPMQPLSAPEAARPRPEGRARRPRDTRARGGRGRP